MVGMRGFTFGMAAALMSLPVALSLWISPAEAASHQPNAYTTTNVNQRAGPGTEYPVIVTVPARSYVTIHGCFTNYAWCDVSSQSARGWMAATYLQAYHSGRYMPVAEFVPLARLPAVAFDINVYWPRYYRDRPFFSQMTRWTTPRRPAVTPATFYRPLSRYGSWVWLGGQHVWVPDRVDRRWRPYTEGRWVNTRSYGWTWVSDEPFGWATYHYGRWGFSKRVGWFWVPGTRWAPAWVAWRGSDDYLAWAPLPPERDPSFSIGISIGTVPDYYWQAVPSSAFLSVNLSNQIIRDDQRYRPILRDTRPLGNVTIVNNVVVNNVVNIQYVEQKTQETVVVHEVSATSNPDQSGAVDEGGTLQVLTAASVEPTEPTVSEAPPEVKTIEEVAAESQTAEQAGDEPATEDLVVAPPPAPEPGAEAETTAPASDGEPSAATEPVEPELPAPLDEPALPPELPAPDAGTPAAPPELPVPAAEMPPPPTELPAPPPELPAPPAELPPPPAETPAAPPELPAPPPELPAPPPEMPAPPTELPPPPAEPPAPPPEMPAPPPEMPAPPAGCPEGMILLDDGSCSAPAQ
jgi:uncharacterized protein YraI